MESALLGLVLDSSAAISAERKKQPVAEFIGAIFRAHGRLDLSLSPVTVAELAHGIYRSNTPETAQRRRQFIEELVSLVPVHPVTNRTAWLVGQIEGQEAAKGNVLPFNDLMLRQAADQLPLPPSNKATPCSPPISATSRRSPASSLSRSKSNAPFPSCQTMVA